MRRKSCFSRPLRDAVKEGRRKGRNNLEARGRKMKKQIGESWGAMNARANIFNRGYILGGKSVRRGTNA